MEKDYGSQGQFRLAPQAGFKDAEGKYVFFTKEDLMYGPNLEKAKSLSQKQIKVFSVDQEHEEMMKFLKDKGIVVVPDANGKFHLPQEAVGGDGKIALNVEMEIDSDLQRAIAKIAFNYLAKIQGADFVLQDRFDPIRSFINGGPYQQLVVPFQEPILIGDSDNYRYLGHIFIFERVGNEIGSKISLFNQGMSYRVLLSSDATGLPDSMSSGHTFNLQTKKINPLGSKKLTR